MIFRSAPKRRGELAEARFLCDAASHGLIVAKPWGDSLPFDFLVGLTRFHRVQVKSASSRHCRGYHLSCFRPADRQPYSPDEIDFLAALIVPERAWYLIPVQELGRRKTLVLFPRQPLSLGRPAGRFEKYREAWSLLAR